MRNLKRRGFIAVIAAGVVTVPGCSTRSVEDIKNESTSPGYDQLYRNIGDYEGSAVTYRGRITDMVESTDSRHEFLLSIGGSFSNPHIFYCIWRGNPYRDGDTVQIWGVVEGLETYRSMVGETTVPRIDVRDMELLG